MSFLVHGTLIASAGIAAVIMPLEPATLITAPVQSVMQQTVEPAVNGSVPLWFYVTSIAAVAGTFSVPIKILWTRLTKIEDERAKEIALNIAANQAVASALEDLSDGLERATSD